MTLQEDKGYIIEQLETAIDYLSPVKEVIYEKETFKQVIENIAKVKGVLVALRDKVSGD